jgi:hypothetical protein
MMTSEEILLQLSDRLAAMEAKLEHLNELPTLAERIRRIESSLMLVPDVYRYQKLQELLAAGNLREADWETIQVILTITGAADLESITPEDMRRFPCNELRVIDNLWKAYSNDRFGFSVQAQIYQSVGGSLEATIAQDYRIIERFGEQVGWRVQSQWRKCDDLDYTLSAPLGCHPSRWWNSPFGSKMTNYFFARLLTCAL